MTSAVVRKYARALADVAWEDKRSDQILTELRSFAQLLGEHEELAGVLTNPALAFGRKRTIIEAVAPAVPLSQTTVNFLLVLLRAGRFGQLQEVIEAYEDALDIHRGILRGTVYSTTQLDGTVRSKLETTLSGWSGKTVQLRYLHDEAMIGGLRVQLGSTIIDGSIRNQLDQIREQLKSD